MFEKIFLGLIFVCVFALWYILGAWMSWTDTRLFDPYLKEAFIGLEAFKKAYVEERHPYNTDVWRVATGDMEKRGVTVLDRGRSFGGYTLIAVGERAYLIDLEGAVVHEWHLPYRDIAEDEEAKLTRSAPGTWFYWKPARVLPNGDLVAVVDLMHATPEGLALIKLDRHSRLLWVLHRHVHHDFDIDESGRIYVLDQTIRNAELAEMPRLEKPFLDEGVLIVSSDGEEVARLSIVEAFRRSDYRSMLNELLRINRQRWGDYLHSNNVDLITGDRARPSGVLTEGQILLSFREISTIAVLDPTDELIVWAAAGMWHKQHDPDPLANGNLLVFDNQGHWSRGGTSRVLEFNPVTREVVWQFPAHEGQSLSSKYRAEQQKLANGNVLINEFEQGRLVEVAPDGEIVWEYHCPFRHDSRPELACRIMHSERYGPDELDFAFDRPRAEGVRR